MFRDLFREREEEEKNYDEFKPVRENEISLMIDQTLLPVEEKWLSLTTSEVEDAIKRLAVRGAPAIVSGGVPMESVRHLEPSKTPEDLKIRFQQAYDGLKSTAPQR